MLHTLTQIISGFSIVSAAILLFAYLFFLEGMQKTVIAKIACTVLLANLSCLQFAHLHFLATGFELFESTPYVVLLLATPPAFYFFSKEILLPGAKKSAFQLVHAVPLLLAIVVPAKLIAPVAFAIGAGYSVWFTRIVYGLRRHLGRFKFEMFFFVFFAVLAALVLLLAVLMPYIDSAVFYIAYANFTGVSMILIVAALIIFPELLADITDAAEMAYASSTLKAVDVAGKMLELDAAMNTEKIFQNENLNLSMLAKAIGLGGHQLSELINTEFGCGFSRYVRERRVAEAKRLLEIDSGASILSISLTTGFKSQSNFYAAFREITGEAPGSYRKQQHDSRLD